MSTPVRIPTDNPRFCAAPPEPKKEPKPEAKPEPEPEKTCGPIVTVAVLDTRAADPVDLLRFNVEADRGRCAKSAAGTDSSPPEVELVERHGARVDLTLIGASSGDSSVFDASLKVLDIGAQARFIDDNHGRRVEIGARLTVAEVGVALGARDPKRQDDARIELRLSAGPSASFEFSTEDTDRDGAPNYRIGVDYGYGGVTIETEKPLETLRDIARALRSPLSIPLILARRYDRA